MSTRRLLVVPVITLLALIVAGAIVDAGRQARRAQASTATPFAALDDDAARSEHLRIRGAFDAATTCSGAVDCGSEATAARTRRVIQQVDAWAYDRRFDLVRSRVRALLAVRAAQLDQQALVPDQRRDEELDDRGAIADRQLVHAQLAAGLIDRPASRARLDELR